MISKDSLLLCAVRINIDLRKAASSYWKVATRGRNMYVTFVLWQGYLFWLPSCTYPVLVQTHLQYSFADILEARAPTSHLFLFSRISTYLSCMHFYPLDIRHTALPLRLPHCCVETYGATYWITSLVCQNKFLIRLKLELLEKGHCRMAFGDKTPMCKGLVSDTMLDNQRLSISTATVRMTTICTVRAHLGGWGSS